MSGDPKEKRVWLTPFKRNQIAAAQQWRCGDCQSLLPARFDIDHKKPLHLGGAATDLENLHALCPNCHAKKSALEMELYWDRERERRQGVSKYFQPHSRYYLQAPPAASEPPCIRLRRAFHRSDQP